MYLPSLVILQIVSLGFVIYPMGNMIYQQKIRYLNISHGHLEAKYQINLTKYSILENVVFHFVILLPIVTVQTNELNTLEG